jgi:hypothetical protein
MTSPLPMINGVCASCVWLAHGDWPSYADFFAQRFADVTPANLATTRQQTTACR